MLWRIRNCRGIIIIITILAKKSCQWTDQLALVLFLHTHNSYHIDLSRYRVYMTLTASIPRAALTGQSITPQNTMSSVLTHSFQIKLHAINCFLLSFSS